LLPCKRKDFQFTDEEIADFAEWELAYWQKRDALLLNWYQISDGPNEFDPEDRFGIRDMDGRAKPQANAIRRYLRGAAA
jgi:hypothetical protein